MRLCWFVNDFSRSLKIELSSNSVCLWPLKTAVVNCALPSLTIFLEFAYKGKVSSITITFLSKSAVTMKFFITVISLAALACGAPSQCPEQYGEQAYAHPEACDQFFLCINGTLTQETCENGLLFDGKGGVHNHCNYNWAVDCGERQHDPTAISTPGCEYQFGIYEESQECSTSYIKCEFGIPNLLPCTKGLVYDDKIHGCNWPDLLLDKCNPEAVIGFKCPTGVDPHSTAARFWPFPRFANPADRHSLFLCTDGHPRLIACGEDKLFDESTLTCEDDE